MLTLALGLLERLGLIIVCAFMLSKTMFFKKYVFNHHVGLFEKVFYILFWGVLGIVMTNLGTPVSGGIANSRTIPVVLAGVLGGPLVGTFAGVIAGVHRMYFAQGGDLTAFSCGISTIIAGILGGLYKPYIDKKKFKHYWGFALGIVVEVIQMGLILLLARPFNEALALVEIIFVPMTFLNALGIGLFLLFVKQIVDENEATSAKMAQRSLEIANLTLSHFKQGLTKKSAIEAAKIIFDLTDYDAVAFTDKEKVLVHLGTGAHHHKSEDLVCTQLTKDAIESAQVKCAQTKQAIGCAYSKCNLSSVMIAPLVVNEKVIGTLKVYKIKENAMLKTDQELVKGLGTLFSTQFELALVEQQKKLRAEAELNTLRAQIKPHFLFNSLNAIMALTRTQPDQARYLLQELSVVLRNGFKHTGDLISLEEELRFVQAYLNIEKARFPDKLNIELLVDKSIHMHLPPLILQPLVENAVKHGIQKKDGSGTLRLIIKRYDQTHVSFIIEDDGIGMAIDLYPNELPSSGIGLSNVRSRLDALYAVELQVSSVLNRGTRIEFKLPFEEAV